MKCEELNNNISIFDSVFQKITESLNYKLTDVFDKKEQQDTKIDQGRFGENIFINSLLFGQSYFLSLKSEVATTQFDPCLRTLKTL